MSDQANDSLVSSLLMELNRLKARVAALEDPHGRLFLADTSSPGSHRAMVEMIPNAAGSALSVLTDGRTVSGATDPGVFLAIDALASGQRAFLGFANGTNAVYVPISEQLRYGVIQAIGPCNSYCTVKESDSDGIILSEILVSIAPAPGGCGTSANGFCYTVGDIIAWMADPKDTTFGVQVGAYKTISVRYVCTTTSTANVPDLSEVAFYNGDFTLVDKSTCGDDGPKNEMDVYWGGNTILMPYATSPSNVGHVKVFDLSQAVPDPSTGTNLSGATFTTLAWHATTGSTSANVPTVGGAPCADASGPQFLKMSVRTQVGITMDFSDPSLVTVVCNENGTITLSGPTMRVNVPITGF